MTEFQTGSGHPPGETSGSSERAAQHLTGIQLAFDLAAESLDTRGQRR
jgi:hypothetical protein